MISVYSTCNSTCKQTVLHCTYILPEVKDPAEVRGKFLNKKFLVSVVHHCYEMKSVPLPVWECDLYYQHRNMASNTVSPACWLCCFLQTQSIHKWRSQWNCGLDVFSRIPSIKGNKWTCTMLWRKQGFLHVGMLLLRWTQSYPWSWKRR